MAVDFVTNGMYNAGGVVVIERCQSNRLGGQGETTQRKLEKHA